MIRHLFSLGLIALALPGATRAADLILESAPTKTHLIELYTSEGCSSCPPAEAWLSKLKNEPRLWQDFVPIAFHVDYWDRLGWRDPFASKQWTARQYEYSAHWGNGSVYTPGFVLDGREWRSPGVPSASSETPGVLKLIVRDDGSVAANFSPSGKSSRKFELHLARLGFDLNINVKAGENSGRKLLHDFVVLGLTNESITSGSKELRLPAPIAPTAEKTRGAVAAWVSEAGQLEPIQAVGGWLP